MRFWHFQRVGKSFRAHVRAGGRRYIYMLPTSLFRPENLAESENFVFTEEMRAKVNQVLSAFVGTHRFHHFTQSIAAKSQEANRTIDSFEVRNGLSF
jgi:tRNA pseudouridine38-40 synthase